MSLAGLIGGRAPPKLDMLATSEGGYSRELQAARGLAAHQRSYFAPALFNLVPVETTLIGSMAVDAPWRLHFNPTCLAPPTVEQKPTLLLHEVSHLLRDHRGRKRA